MYVDKTQERTEMSLQKSPRYLNPRLLELARGMPCQNCGIEDGTVVAAHSNAAKHGHGRGIKSHDCFWAGLCFRCHAWLDQDYGVMDGYSSKREDKLLFFTIAMHKTMSLLLRAGKIKMANDVDVVKIFSVDNESAILDYWRNGRIRVV